jgi:hypothetical protein
MNLKPNMLNGNVRSLAVLIVAAAGTVAIAAGDAAAQTAGGAPHPRRSMRSSAPSASICRAAMPA